MYHVIIERAIEKAKGGGDGDYQRTPLRVSVKRLYDYRRCLNK